jgi:hypothetical protein
MIPTRRFLFAAIAISLLTVAACDGVATGEKAQVIPVTENASGGYGPIAVTLTMEMSPVAMNFRAQHGTNPADVGKWNTYRASLKKGGQEIAGSQFNINYTGTNDGQVGASTILQNMLTARPGETGDYELTITPTKPVEVKLTNTQVEVRRNVAGNANAR